MEEIKINDEIAVLAIPDSVVIQMQSVFDNEGETHQGEVFVGLTPQDAIKLANAILHAAANLPVEPDDFYMDDGSINPAYA